MIRLIEAVEGLKAQLDVPPTIRGVLNKAGSSEADAAYLATTLEMAYQAFDDQCTGANPRYPVRVLSLVIRPAFVFVSFEGQTVAQLPHPLAALVLAAPTRFCVLTCFAAAAAAATPQLVKDLRQMLEDAYLRPVLPVASLEFASPQQSCLKSRLRQDAASSQCDGLGCCPAVPKA